MLTRPLEAVTGMDIPVAPAAELLPSRIVADGSGAFPARVSVTVASTASGIVVVFKPHAMHVAIPAELLHDRDLPEAAGPGATVMEEKSAVEYPKVHWADAGCGPVAFNDRLRATVLPGAPAADERLSAVVWARQVRQAAKAITAIRTIRDRSA
jgi:hypothetical protein